MLQCSWALVGAKSDVDDEAVERRRYRLRVVKLKTADLPCFLALNRSAKTSSVPQLLLALGSIGVNEYAFCVTLKLEPPHYAPPPPDVST